jgi:putative SOS response-associated peptidase YedK
MEKFHDRMPAILHPEHEDKWLNKEITDPLDALMFLEPTKDSEMEEYVVSKEVNRPGNDWPDLILPEK